MKKGSKVEIIANMPFPLKDKPKPILATVVNINGAYVLVKPKYQRWVVDLLDCEVRLIK